MTLAASLRSSLPVEANHVGRPWIDRFIILAVILAAVAAGVLLPDSSTSSQGVAQAGADLTRLMRFMAALKGLMAVGAALAVLWRLGSAVTTARLAAYAVACGTMAAGPGLIWGMAHVGLGALLLHGGLLATVLMLWRDPAVAMRMEHVLHRRRTSVPLRSGGIMPLRACLKMLTSPHPEPAAERPSRRTQRVACFDTACRPAQQEGVRVFKQPLRGTSP